MGQQLSKTIKTLAAKKAKLSATKKEAPKGGVAMFGGANLFGDNNNPFAHRRGDSDKEEENEEMETEAQNGKLHSKNNILPEKFAPKTFDSIAIQPDAEETGIDLSTQPSSDHVISSVLKDRPKIPQKRKLPSKVSQRLDGEHDIKSGLSNGSLGNDQQHNERNLAEAVEKEKLEKEGEEKERKEKDRLEKERQEQERIEKERREKDRLEKERIEKERIAKERQEQERIARERKEKEKLERERQEKEKIEKERQEKEKIEREQL